MTTRTHLQVVAGILIAVGVLISVGATTFKTWVPLVWVLVTAAGARATLRAHPWAKWLVYLSAYVGVAGYLGGTLEFQRRWPTDHPGAIASVAWATGAIVIVAASIYCCYVATAHLRPSKQ